MDYYSGEDLGTGFTGSDQIVGWNSGEANNAIVQQVKSGTDIFRQLFTNAMGRPPTQDELGSFQTQALKGAVNAPGDLTYGDTQGLANSYINSTYGPQIAAAQQQKQTDAATKQLQTTEQQGLDLVNKLNQQSQQYLMSPESQASIQGSLNNKGLLNSGAYNSTLAGLMAQSANQNQSSVLQGVGIPALSNIQGLSSLSGGPYQQSIQSGNAGLNNLENISNFGMQSDLARYLADQGQPSTAQSIMGLASGSAQGAGSLLQGASAAKGATPSYVCREMVKRNLLCESDLEDFYLHMFDAVWYKARAFWHYKLNGQKLVDLANEKGIDWIKYKTLLFDRVMEEKDPIRSNELFADACRQLCMETDPDLWDERVMRSSILDSLLFIPLLFTDKTFGKNFWKILRIKTMFLYDKPMCMVHR
jgi:hypothetical protein